MYARFVSIAAFRLGSHADRRSRWMARHDEISTALEPGGWGGSTIGCYRRVRRTTRASRKKENSAMSTWFNDAWAYVRSQLPGPRCPERALVPRREALRGAPPGGRRGGHRLAGAVSPVAAAHPGPVGPGRVLGEPAHADRRARHPPADGERYLLQLRTVLPPRTIDQFLDNVACAG